MKRSPGALSLHEVTETHPANKDPLKELNLVRLRRMYTLKHFLIRQRSYIGRWATCFTFLVNATHLFDNMVTLYIEEFQLLEKDTGVPDPNNDIQVT